MHADSLDKVITRYFAAVTAEFFVYKGIGYQVQPLTVSPLLFRGFTCPTGCGGCCPRFSLDYLPAEEHPVDLPRRHVEFLGKPVVIFSDLQTDHNDHHCRHLNKDDARCGIYQHRPFSCDFELIRFFQYGDHTRLSQQLFGRGWSFLRADGKSRGALCTMLPVDEHTRAEVTRKLKRLKQWCEHFGLRHRVDVILAWAETRPTIESPPLVV